MAASTEKLMHAVQYEAYGAIGLGFGLKHVEVPIPSPKRDEVLLKLEAASLNPIDWKIQKGVLRPFMPRKFPFVPAMLQACKSPLVTSNLRETVTDVAGEVVDVGPGVTSFKPGDKVVSVLYQVGGGLAEYAVASVSLTVHRPQRVSAAEAAGLPIAGLAALQALQSTGAKFDGSGEPANILITAASGGVGLYAVQLAKLGNLHVTATCGYRNLGLVRSLGADEVLDYETPEGANLESPSGKKYGAVINAASGIPWSTYEANLSENGKVIDLNPGLKAFLTFLLKKITFSGKQLRPLFVTPNGKDLEFLVGLVEAGKLKTVVDSKYPLSNAVEAWATCMDGHASGKIIIEMGA